MDGCAACPIRCKRTVAVDGRYKVDPKFGGPEYETLGALGSCCGVDDLEAISWANQLCNRYSLDTISLGVTISFAMECFENGFLTPDDTGGIALHFGDAGAMVQMVEQVARRQGIGDLLAEGSQRAAEQLGRGAEAFAMQVKGLEIPMHEPRLKQGMGLSYAVESQGADHCSGLHDTAFVMENLAFDHFRGLGAVDPVPAGDLSHVKAANFKAAHMYNLFLDSAVCCKFPPWTATDMANIIRAATGWEYTVHEAVRLGERIAALARMFNLREGITADADGLPERFFTGTRRGALQDLVIEPAELQAAISAFYGMMGWDPKTGVPGPETLGALGIGWAAEHLR
jgi:aldehyde:ferredoxin oxidoreductase